jgi:translation elongation factor EF-1alpha
LATVKGIECNGFSSQFVAAGTICEIGLNLPKDFDVNYLKKGTVLCDIKYSIPLVKRFVATVVVYDLP